MAYRIDGSSRIEMGEATQYTAYTLQMRIQMKAEREVQTIQP